MTSADPNSDTAAAARLSSAQAVLLVIAVASAIRIVLAASVGLGIDESYMAGVARQFSWSYLDHPPLHVWLTGASGRLFGEHPLALRLPFIVLFAGTTWLMFRLTAMIYGARAGLWAALALTLAPAFTLSTASWVLPDGPMMFFALLGATCAARVMFGDAPRSPLAWWLAAGAAGGLAVLSKYLGAFLFIGIGLFLLLSPRHRHWIARKEPWLGVLLAALMMIPVLIWNLQHGFASFVFQGQRGVPEAFNINWLLQEVGGQLLYLLPWLAVPLAVAVAQAFRGDDAARYFGWLAAPAIVIFTLLGFVTRVLPHWPMIGWLFAFPLLGRALAQHEPAYGRLIRRSAAATAVVLVGALALAASHAATGWVSRAAPGLLAKDPTLDLYDWRGLASALSVPPGGFIGAVHWIEAGKVNYALGRETPVLCLCSDARHFAYLNDRRGFIGRDAVLVSRSGDALRTAAVGFDRFERMPDIVLTRGGLPAVTLKAARGFGYKGAP